MEAGVVCCPGRFRIAETDYPGRGDPGSGSAAACRCSPRGTRRDAGRQPGRPPSMAGRSGCRRRTPTSGAAADDRAPRRGPGDLRRDHRRPAALRPRPGRRRRRRRGGPPGRRAAPSRRSSTTSPAGGATTPASGSSPRPPRSSTTPTRCSRSVPPPCTRAWRTRLVILLRAMGTPAPGHPQAPPRRRQVLDHVDDGGRRVGRHVGDHRASGCTRATSTPGSTAATRRASSATVPTVFGLPPAQIVHDECESDGFPACIYHLTWDRRSRLPRRRTRRPRPPRPSSTPCAGSCASCSPPAPTWSPATTSSTALHRIVARAAEAVLAPAYLLAVADPAGGDPLVHSAGRPRRPGRRPGRRALLAGEDLGEGAVVVDVASARRNHGRLAALYRDGAGVMGEEASMLAAYAGHAAAALDLIIALEGARQEAERASALLELAHELSAATDAAAVNDIVSEALPRIVGCTSAGILLLGPGDRLAAAPSPRSASPTTAGRGSRRPGSAAEDVPELVGMLTDREPRHPQQRHQQPGAAPAAGGRRARPTSSPSPCSPTAPSSASPPPAGAAARRPPASTATSSPASAASATRRRRRCRRPGCWRPSATRPPTTR